MTAKMLELISRSDDLKDPALKGKFVEELASMAARISENDIKTESEKIFSNAYVDRDVYDFNKNFADFIIKE